MKFLSIPYLFFLTMSLSFTFSSSFLIGAILFSGYGAASPSWNNVNEH